MQAEVPELKTESIPYSQTEYFQKIVLDYLSASPKLEPFYDRRPEVQSFEAQMVEKVKSYRHREVLVKALKRQYSAQKLPVTSIDTLTSENAFTITTGHQVCLFTGPVYFFYKIISTIKSCRILKDAYPEREFVPIFWMATEDHDFEEANHFFIPQAKIEWESGQGGAVGRMKTVGMDQLSSDLESLLGIGYRPGELLTIFRKAYEKHDTIAKATRYLVHHFFGKLGVIAIDGDDPELKALMKSFFRKELVENASFGAIEETNKALEKDYPLQVTPREINLFYLDDEFRERIVRNDDGQYEVLNSKLNFSEEEILGLLENSPERFSPNVVLRPLYQEVVLPNLAYIGGGGELSYWFQLGGVFRNFEVPFPILMLRNSVMIINKEAQGLLNELRLNIHELFGKSGIEIEKELVRRESSEVLNLGLEREELEALFLLIKGKLKKVDKLLERSAESAFVRSDRMVENLEKKMLKAERKKHQILAERLHKLREILFPRDGLQERNMNFIPFYLEYGPDWVEKMVEILDPFKGEFTLVRL